MSLIKQILYSANCSLILICVQLITSTQQWPIDDTGCITPDSGAGVCISADECGPIINFIKNSLPLTAESNETLSSYYCGVMNNAFKVCCPNKPIVSSNVIIKGRTINNEPPDVKNHKNVNLLPNDCGLQLGSPRITGGNQTALSEFPWMALLSYTEGRVTDFRCGGTIINEWYILTAAHCLTNLDKLQLIGVRVGEYNISSVRDCEKDTSFGEEFCSPPVQDFAIGEAIPHPLFNSTSYAADIGLIRLAERMDLTVENAKPICLPIGDEVRNKSFDDAVFTITGWGATEDGRTLSVLHKADIPAVLKESCHKTYKNFSVVVDGTHICAGGRSHEPCSGDSGGPLQSPLLYMNDYRYVQFGVVSYGPRICGRLQGFPSLYARVDFYMDWILDTMKP